MLTTLHHSYMPELPTPHRWTVLLTVTVVHIGIAFLLYVLGKYETSIEPPTTHSTEPITVELLPALSLTQTTETEKAVAQPTARAEKRLPRPESQPQASRISNPKGPFIADRPTELNSATSAPEIPTSPASSSPTTASRNSQPDTPSIVVSAAGKPNQVQAEAASSGPEGLYQPKPNYPVISRRLGEFGSVRLRILVLASGTVGEVQLLESSGFSRLDSAAIATVKNWKFSPAKKSGQPIDFWATQNIRFTLDD